MPLFGRAGATEEPATADVPPTKPGGKGRPTPKRSEAQPRRSRAATAGPTSRREAYRLRRARIAEDRQRLRAGLRTGDERNLPARDAGPVRRYVRDLVDARRNAGGAFLPLAVVVLSLSVAGGRSKTFAGLVEGLYLAIFVAITIDSWRLIRMVRARVRAQFGEPATRGIGVYAFMRSVQVRRLRQPPPKVARGATVTPPAG